MPSQPIALHADNIRLEDYPYDSKTTGLRSWRRPLVHDEETGVSVSVQRHPAGDSGRWHTHHCGHGMYVIGGTLSTNFGDFGPGSFVWFEPGVTMRHGAPSDDEVVYLFITDREFDIDYLDPQSPEVEQRVGREMEENAGHENPHGSQPAEVEESTRHEIPRHEVEQGARHEIPQREMEENARHEIPSSGVTLLRPKDMTLHYRDDDVRHVYGRRTLFEGGPNGMEVKLQHFEPGCMTTWHTHHCAHGAWVLGGTYHTSIGDFGPGSFVWFPEGMRMEHGTSGDPCDLLFITNKRFDITFE